MAGVDPALKLDSASLVDGPELEVLQLKFRDLEVLDIEELASLLREQVLYSGSGVIPGRDEALGIMGFEAVPGWDEVSYWV